MGMKSRIAAAFLCLVTLLAGSIVASAGAESSPDNTVWQVATSGLDLNSVFFKQHDSQRGWAVGNDGTILATQDGGKHWTPQISPTTDNLYGVAFADDGLQGLVVGGSGTILKTADGGGVWTSATKGVPKVVLEGVALSEDGHLGWAVGLNGIILRNKHDGRLDEWELQTNLPPGANASAFHAIAANKEQAWVVGDTGRILWTDNKGGTWHKLTNPVPKSLRSVVFASDGQVGWAVGDEGTILYTDDGGNKWNQQTSQTTENLFAVAFGTDKSGWAVGAHGTILWTTNHGRDWRSPPIKTISKDILGVSLVNVRGMSLHKGGLHGWAVGKDGTVLTTTSIPGKWILQRSSTSEVLTAVAPGEDASHGWAVGSKGSILSTEDGGNSWTLRKKVDGELYGIAVAGSHVWAVGLSRPSLMETAGVILTNLNGDEKWTSSTWPHPLKGVAVSADAQQAWAVGSNGTILTATKGSDQWNRQESGTGEDLTSVAFDPDGRHGLAVGAHGTILATGDSGLNWEAKALGLTPYDLRGVAFAGDHQHAWAVGPRGTVLETTYNGSNWDNWDLRPDVPSVNLWGVVATVDDRVWAVGDKSTIVTSWDDGEKWIPQRSPSTDHLRAIAANGLAGWAVGAEGTVLIPVEKPVVVPDQPKQSDSQIITSFRLRHSNPWIPVWSAYVKARKRPRGDWHTVGEFYQRTRQGPMENDLGSSRARI